MSPGQYSRVSLYCIVARVHCEALIDLSHLSLTNQSKCIKHFPKSILSWPYSSVRLEPRTSTRRSMPAILAHDDLLLQPIITQLSRWHLSVLGYSISASFIFVLFLVLDPI